MHEALGETLWSKQVEIVESIRDHKRTAVKSAFDVGKSYSAALAVAWFMSTRRNAVAFTTAPTNRQVKNILWRYMRAAHRKGSLPGKITTAQWEIAPDWYAFGFSPKDYDPTSIQGIHAPEVIVGIDEADGVPRQIWQACEGLIAGDLCRIAVFGNPEDPQGAFADCFRSNLWNQITISAFDSPNVTGEMEIPGLVGMDWIEQQRERGLEGTAWWMSRVLGLFPEQGADTLIALRWVERALQRPTLEDALPLDMPDGARHTIGVDVARSGPDPSSIAMMLGRKKLVYLDSEHGRDLMEQANKAAWLAKRHSASRIRVDAIGGLGAAVVDRLRELRREGAFTATVEPIHSGDDAQDDEQFFSLRCEMWWDVREALQADELDLSACPDHLRAEVVRDFTGPKYGFRKGKLWVETKDDVRKRKIPSPNCADAIMLARMPEPSGVFITFGDPDDIDDDVELEDDLDDEFDDEDDE